MDSTIKNLTITGSAASTPDVIKPRRGTTKRRLPKPEEDNNEHQEPADTKFVISKVDTQPQQKPRIKEVLRPQVQPQLQPQVQVQPQLQLQPNPKEITSVTLNPPKARVKLMPKTLIKPIQAQVNQTRKVRRVQLPNLSNRITRAKKIYSETKKTPIDTIKNYLIQKGVIQAKSKAPELMLRSMYGDFNMLKDGHAL